MSNEVWTIKRLIEFTTDYFEKAGIDSPRIEAEILLSYALKKKRIDLYINFDKTTTKEELAFFKELIKRRRMHEPSAYITGMKSFMSLDFIVTKDVLIPRPETEHIVTSAIDAAKAYDIKNILDIGTGCGAIAVSLAKYIPDTRITATDISPNALNIAKENAEKHMVADRIKFMQTDVFPGTSEEKYDLIISNPPYIKSETIKGLQPEVKDHEPMSALDGGSDGMNVYNKILGGAKEFLSENGRMIFEIDPPLTETIKSAAKEAGYKNIEILEDLAGLARVALIS
jgi:release factor glutamine methyltransferase